jgi:hypothetical protein
VVLGVTLTFNRNDQPVNPTLKAPKIDIKLKALVWANFQQRALDVAIVEVNTKTDLKIKVASIERSKHHRVVALNFTIKAQAIPKRPPET